jgi:two-component sensor histidine kinase
VNPRRNNDIVLAGRRPIAILILLGIAGLLLSIYIGRQEATQYATLERLKISELVDDHFSTVTDHLSVRETVASVVASLFNPPPLTAARPLRDFGSQVTSIVPDIQTVGWLPEVPASIAEDALLSMRNSDVENPRFVDRAGKPVEMKGLDRPLYPIIDVAPDSNRWILGVDAGSFPERLDAIRRARDTRKIARTRPVRLVQAPDANALLIYAPVFKNEVFRGVLGFGYRVDRLFTAALTTPKPAAGFDIHVMSDNTETPLFELPANGVARIPAAIVPDENTTLVERRTEFAGRPLFFIYSLKRNLARESFWRGMMFAAVSLAITAATITLLGFMMNRAVVLASEVRSRRSAEDRLKVVIHELNHRVRNVLSVVQAVVRLSFTPGYSLNDVQKTCEGRLQALANAMSLLTASDWRSVSFRNLISEDIIPFADRISTQGPDLALRPRSAQTFALLLYELATNAAKHGALSVPGGKVSLTWDVDRTASPQAFRLHWRESGGPLVEEPKRRGFGELLVRRIAPRDVAGHAKVGYEPQGFSYELEAALSEIEYDPQRAEKPLIPVG